MKVNKIFNKIFNKKAKFNSVDKYTKDEYKKLEKDLEISQNNVSKILKEKEYDV